MPRVKTTPPDQDKQKGQRSLNLPLYLDRVMPIWRTPDWMFAKYWRGFVANQPFATICRDTMIDMILALDWKIEPKDSTQRDELKDEIDYYTDFIDDTGDYDYSEIIEWIGKDALDLPFGGAAEVGRENDEPDGRVLWLELLDGGTLFPTLNSIWTVGQSIPERMAKSVYFPYYAINRVYLSPRTDIRRKGWGMAPPERIYLAIELLNRGDYYYSSLLLDTPEAGILDLMDMSQASAEEWVQAWHKMLMGVDPFKIPVLYEHNNSAKFISFTRNPSELMFDKAIMKYASITAAGYGMSLSDLGVQVASSGGETLAGSIRSERKTRRTGVSLMKRKFRGFFSRLLPEYLRFSWIDLDDELSVAVGRSRLANATAIDILVKDRVLLPNEGRQQLIADGLITISIPETIEGGDEFFMQPELPPNERPGLLGKPIAPSQGGYGEVKSDIVYDTIEDDAYDIALQENLLEENLDEG